MEEKIQDGRHVWLHRVQYYETDGMQIVHHSNYIRWMEEARCDYLSRVNLDYDRMEADGILIPVLSVSCEYRNAVRFGETVRIFAQVENFSGLKFEVSYRITSLDETVLHATGTTTHCFLNRELKPVNVKKIAPDIYAHFIQFKKKPNKA